MDGRTDNRVNGRVDGWMDEVPGTLYWSRSMVGWSASGDEDGEDAD